MNSPHTLIIGAGAAGLSAACFCSGSVLVLERMGSPGRKLLATGGGRCNFTHDSTPEEIARSFGRNSRFTAPAIFHFPPSQIREFFHQRGVPTVVQPDGCVFPESQRANDILYALLKEAKRNGVNFETEVRVDRLVTEPSAGNTRRIACVQTSAGDFFPQRVILATGGCSYSWLGSDGSGLRMLEELGLAVEPPVPALAALRTVETWPFEATGIVLKNAALILRGEGGAKHSCEGEILFTHEGISAPTALNLAGEIAVQLMRKQGEPVSIELNLERDRSAEQWLTLFEGWRTNFGGRAIHNLLAGELPRAIAQILCQKAGLMDCAIARASKKNLQALVSLLTACPLHINDTDGWSRAMLTRGGLAVKELNPRTLACRSISNLYCVGEVVDVDGPCGGYNLTWAFASGALAASELRKISEVT